MFVDLSVLRLTFISSIWFPTDDIPSALKTVANIFPLRPLGDGLQYAFDPRTTGAGFNGRDIRMLAIWTVIGIVLLLRFLRSPHGEQG